MAAARGGRRLGAGRKPKQQAGSVKTVDTQARTALETIKGLDAGQEPRSPVVNMGPFLSGEQEAPMTGWLLVQYIASYIASKDYRALGLLARQHNGIALLRNVARFFDAATRYAERESDSA